MRVAFESDEGKDDLRGLDIFIDLVFFIDILLTFNTPVQVQNGILIHNRREIACHYIKGFFILYVLHLVS